MKESEYNAVIKSVRSLSRDIYISARSAHQQTAMWAVDEYRNKQFGRAIQFAKSSATHARTMRNVEGDLPFGECLPKTRGEEIVEVIASRAAICCKFILRGDEENTKYWADSVAWWQTQRLHYWEPADNPPAPKEGGAL